MDKAISEIKEGEQVVRMLAGIVPIKLTVSKVYEDRIECGPWTFDRETGAEIDDELGWGVEKTGSFIKIDDLV